MSQGRATAISIIFSCIIALAGLLLSGCGSVAPPGIEQVTPAQRATAVDPLIQPRIVFSGEVQVDASGRRVVLLDRTHGGRMTVAGTVKTKGAELVYVPDEPLAQGHEFELVVEPDAVGGELPEAVDLAEAPSEPIGFPFRLRFSTGAAPRVRAAYLGRGGGDIDVHFSQPMDPLATGVEINVVDRSGDAREVGQHTWPGVATVRLTLTERLDPATVYRLVVGARAAASNGTFLDQDADGEPGESTDTFEADFAGSQQVIVSRHRDSI